MLRYFDKDCDPEKWLPTVTFSEWLKYVHFVPGKQNNIIIFRDNDVELTMICWDSNSKSPIHDHGGQECWLIVLQGTICETLYDDKFSRVRRHILDVDSNVTKSPLGFHKVHPINNQAVTLHIYKKPIRKYSVYDKNTSELSTVTRD